ncbi:MAG: hypothetical protein LAO05_13975 [Acidobacteriia bacterium]|nr:hypothetical protein [Terriglobia bacterium]
MVATLEVDEVAEANVLAALRKLHYSIVQHDLKDPRGTRIEAWRGRQRIFALLNTVVSPAELRPLTLEEEQSLRCKAVRAGGQPWEVRVFLKSDLQLVRLEWRPLGLQGFAMDGPDLRRED